MTSGNEARILCIDDDVHTSVWVKGALKLYKIDCEITTAKSGREAFRLLNNEKFDLCILEYALPDMTGVQLCSLMRQMGCTVPMMFLTAMNRAIDREKAAAAGASDYLCKPDDLDLFADAAAHLIRKHRKRYAAPAVEFLKDYARAA